MAKCNNGGFYGGLLNSDEFYQSLAPIGNFRPISFFLSLMRSVFTNIGKCSQTQLLIFVLLRGVST